MNGELEYAKLLKEMEHEVTNLKTAHQRPLGALNFFVDKITFGVDLDYEYGVYRAEFRVVVKIATPVAKPPILQPEWDTPANFPRIFVDSFVISADYETWTYNMSLTSASISSATIKFGVLSSQPIENISWSYR